MSHKRAALLGILVSLPLLFAGLREIPAAGEVTAASPAEIRIDNFAYSPPTLVIARGTTVTWRNDDVDVHTVVEKDRKFKSAALDTDDTFSQTFAVPGEYQYFCSLHPQMVGKIVVEPAGSS
jgi:plastocyanin